MYSENREIGGTSAAASRNVTTPRSLPTLSHSSRLMEPSGPNRLRKNIIAVRGLIARSSSWRVSTQITFAPVWAIWAS